MKRSSGNLTPSQTANLLAVSPSTLRLWSAQFANYLSAEAQSDGRKHRSYSPDDLNLLQRASTLLKTHSPDEVKALLTVGNETQRGAALATLPTIAGEINMLRSQVAALAGDVADLQAARQADRAELDRLRGEVAGLFDRQRKRQAADRAEIDDLRARIDDLQARRRWWQRLRG